MISEFSRKKILSINEHKELNNSNVNYSGRSKKAPNMKATLFFFSKK